MTSRKPDKPRPTIREAATYAEKKARLDDLGRRVEAGGGEKNIARQHERGKLLATERAQLLFDKGSFHEMNRYMASARDIPRAGVLTGWGLVGGRPAVIIANLNDVKAGAWYPETIQKILKAQDYAHKQRIPTVFLVDCAGAFLPEQDHVFPDHNHAGDIFNRMSLYSGIFPQVAGVFGPCVAGGGYVPGLADFSPFVKGRSSAFLAGPKLAKAAVGEEISEQDLGGSKVHCELSGVGDLEVESDEACIEAIRKFLSYLPTNHTMPAPRLETGDDPLRTTGEIAAVVPEDTRKVYDMRKIVTAITDRDSWFELRPRYARQMLTGFARLDGFPVGIVANQPNFYGGVIDTLAADKTAWFISLCDSFNVPLLFFQDVPGFMVGSKAEHRGIIHAGARMIQNLARATVPKLTVVVRKAYGAGYYAMCGTAFGPRRIFGLPWAEIAVMASSQVGQVVFGEKLAGAEGAAREQIETEMRETVERHDRTVTVEYAASRGWIDEILEPEQVRPRLAAELKLSLDSPVMMREGKRPVMPV
ncbi:MAG: acyl-CoA carboxylase subunit beta [Deltaproteobacteria bacterium]|nr:acyl-CoA carboxylase subunit beta [Deltaproteobacteria bacterium]